MIRGPHARTGTVRPVRRVIAVTIGLVAIGIVAARWPSGTAPPPPAPASPAEFEDPAWEHYLGGDGGLAADPAAYAGYASNLGPDAPAVAEVAGRAAVAWVRGDAADSDLAAWLAAPAFVPGPPPPLACPVSVVAALPSRLERPATVAKVPVVLTAACADPDPFVVTVFVDVLTRTPRRLTELAGSAPSPRPDPSARLAHIEQAPVCGTHVTARREFAAVLDVACTTAARAGVRIHPVSGVGAGAAAAGQLVGLGGDVGWLTERLGCVDAAGVPLPPPCRGEPLTRAATLGLRIVSETPLRVAPLDPLPLPLAAAPYSCDPPVGLDVAQQVFSVVACELARAGASAEDTRGLAAQAVTVARCASRWDPSARQVGSDARGVFLLDDAFLAAAGVDGDPTDVVAASRAVARTLIAEPAAGFTFAPCPPAPYANWPDWLLALAAS